MKLDYPEDPQLGDESNPKYRRAMFVTYAACGLKPEDLTNIPLRAEYEAWLKAHA